MFIRTRSNYTDNPSTRVLVTQHFWEIHVYVRREIVSFLIISILTYKIRMLANDLAGKMLEKKFPSKAIRFICLHVRSSLITKESDNYTTWVKIDFALGGGGARIKTLKGKTEFQINSCVTSKNMYRFWKKTAVISNGTLWNRKQYEWVIFTILLLIW